MAPPPVPKQGNGLAIGSLICGLGSLFTGPLTGIAAIVTGHLALGRIRRGSAAAGGAGMALTGLIFGWVMTVLSVLALLTLPLVIPQVKKSRERARLADALNKVRQVKFAMDGYAADHGGKYPEAAPGSTGAWSNDYFRALFLEYATASEAIFWVRDSPVAGDPPDDHIGGYAGPDPREILLPGEVHWAYMSGQTQTSTVSRPLLLDPFMPRTQEFDPGLWDRKAIVLRIDSSAKALRMRLSDGKVLDGSGVDILSPRADAWERSGEDPNALLRQPEPR